MRATVDQENFDKLKMHYTTCMDTDTIKAIGVKPITDLVADFSKVFPVEDAAYASGGATVSVADAKTLGNSFSFVEKLGVDVFFSSFVGADDKDPVRRHPARKLEGAVPD